MTKAFQINSLKPVIICFMMVISTSILAQSTFQSIDIGTNGTPRGYWEFLPAEYHNQPAQDFPVLIFFHGLGNGGNGSTDLSQLLGNGPPKMVNDDLQNNVFANSQVIMLAPQLTNGTWWNENHMRPYLDHVSSQYRIDQQRIYFIGQSAGSSGIHQFMNDDPHAHQVSAIIVTGVRGKVDRQLGAYLAEFIPYWGLTAVGDASNTLTDSANRMAGYLQNINATNLMSGYTNDGSTHTAYHHPDTGWAWVSGTQAMYDNNPLVTLYPGSNHNSWDITYNNPDVWSWLFSQQKPLLEITFPNDNAVYPLVDMTLEALAVDQNQQVLQDIAWYSDLDGFLGVGHQLSVSLSAGTHNIDALVSDQSFRGDIKHVTITMDPALSDLIYTNGFEISPP